jgi:hypothetical protein
MKKYALLVIAVFSISSFAAAWEMLPRFFELGVDFEFGAANSFLSLGDFFNSGRTLKIDLDRLGGEEFGLDLIARGGFFMNVQTRGEHWIGVGFYSGLDVLGFFTVPEDAMNYLFNDGDLSNLHGSLEAGGSVFADMGLKTRFKAGKFKVAFNPAMYVPLIYMGKPDISYRINGTNPLAGNLRADFAAYAAVPVDRDSFDSFSLNTDDLFAVPKGFDLSLDISYSLFPFMDVGGAAEHIPLYPAFMQYGAKVTKTYVINENNLDLSDLLDGGLGGIISPEPGADDLVFFSDAHEAVFRPLRFSAYTVLKPFRGDWLAFKPWLGLSVFTVYDSVCFNFGLDAQFKVVNMLNFYYAFSHMEKVWQNRFGVGVNIRVLEVLAGAGFRSRDFVGAWNIKGAYATVGLRFGF